MSAWDSPSHTSKLTLRFVVLLEVLDRNAMIRFHGAVAASPLLE